MTGNCVPCLQRNRKKRRQLKLADPEGLGFQELRDFFHYIKILFWIVFRPKCTALWTKNDFWRKKA